MLANYSRMSSHASRLPACERCRIRKTRCDRAAPKCTSCHKGNSACVILDPTSNEKVSRAAIHELEVRLKDLESKHAVQTRRSATATSPSDHRRQQSLYVGDGSGLNLFSEVSRNAEGHTDRVQLLRHLDVPSPSAQRQANIHPLPPYDQAIKLIDHYLTHSHLHHPFLARQDVHDCLERVYIGDPSHSRPDDQYRLFMIFAISTVTTFRRGETSLSPYGYYHAALSTSGGVHMDGSIRCIQNILLVARFAMYYHIDCSIWDLSRLCMRQCIELGLHRPPREPLSPLEEQLSRNIFWDSYVHDRYSSGIIGRPYAIPENDITVGLPIPVTERDIAMSQALSLDLVDLHTVDMPNDACVPIFVIKLRRLTTQIQTQFFDAKPQEVSSEKVIQNAARLQAKFDHFWRTGHLPVRGTSFHSCSQSVSTPRVVQIPC